MDNFIKNIPQFTYFNLRLSTNLKYIALALCKNTLPKGADYTKIYKNFNTTCQPIFNQLLNDVYSTNKIICSAFDSNSNISTIKGIDATNINLFMTQDFRILYNINTPSSYTTENICFDDKYLKSGYFEATSNTDFRQWAFLDPTTLLNVCKKNYNRMYADLINYTANVPPNKSFSLPPLNLDAAYHDNSMIVACSLRLINSNYNGPCMKCSIKTGGKGKSMDISFDKETGVFSYDDIYTLLKINDIHTTIPPPSTIEINIDQVYNQMDKDQSNPFKSSPGDVKPILQWYKSTPYILWPTGGGSLVSNTINFKVNNPVITIFTNAGKLNDNSGVEITPTLENEDTKDKHVNIVSIGDNNYNVYSMGYIYSPSSDNPGKYIPRLYTNLINNYRLTTTTYDIKTYGLSSLPPIDMTKTNKFSTHTCVAPSSTSLDVKQNAFISNYSSKQNNVTTITSDDQYGSGDDSSIYWFPKNLDETARSGPFISSELVIFVTDNTNVQFSDINKLSKDNYNMYYSDKYTGDDERCNDMVELACKFDNTNEICACYPSYIDKNINNVIDNLSLSNTDKWCVSPLCSSNIAYKNNINKNNSYCTQICNSSLNIENKPYSSTNVDQTQIFSNCTNTNVLLDSQGTDCNNCKDDEFCSLSSTGKRVCVKKSSCNLPCKDNYSCVIGKDNTKKCFPTTYTTQKCTSDAYCASSEKCDENFNICLPIVSNPDWIPILIGLGTFVVCVIIFILYKKIIMKEKLNLLSKDNIKFYVLIFIVTAVSIVIYFTLIKKHEYFNNSYHDYNLNTIMKDKIPITCTNNKDCNKQNSSCVNNICSCLTGYNYPDCTTNDTSICNSLCYLPKSPYGGTYFYITQLNNTLYAFSNKGVYKFLNTKWYETDKLNNPNLNKDISGFNPYFCNFIINKKYFIPNNLCNTYNNKMIMYIPADSPFINSDRSMNSNSFIVSFSPQNISPDFNKLNDPNNNNISSSWELTYTYTQSGVLSFYNENSVNNIVSIVNNNNLYIFGGHSNNGTINQKIIQISLLDPSNIVEIDTSQQLNFFSFAKCLQSSVNKDIIYIVGVQPTTDTGVPDIYSFDINNIKTANNKTKSVILDKIASCPKDILDTQNTEKGSNIIPNNGSLFIFNTNIGTIDYVNFVYNNSINILQLSNKDKTETIISNCFQTNNYSDKAFADTIIKNIFPKNNIIGNNNIVDIPSVVSYIMLNDFLFVVTGDGSIFKISDYASPTPVLVPTLPVDFTGPPIYNKNPALQTPNGFQWSNELGGFYQLPPKDNITTSCVSCTTYCHGDDNDTSTCYPAVYKTQDCYYAEATEDDSAFGINYAWAGTKVGPTWGGGKGTGPGGCNKSDDTSKCRMYATHSITDKNVVEQLSTIKDNNYPIFFCSNNTDDTPFNNNKGPISPSKPNWIQTATKTNPNPGSYFIRNTKDNDHDTDTYQTCRGTVDTTTYPYCTIPDN